MPTAGVGIVSTLTAMEDSSINKRKPDRARLEPKLTLYHFFKKKNSDPKKMEEDDVIFVKEVKDAERPVEKRATARKSLGSDARDMIPKRLKDVLRRKRCRTSQKSVTASPKKLTRNLVKNIGPSAIKRASSGNNESSNTTEREPSEQSPIQSKSLEENCAQKTTSDESAHSFTPSKVQKGSSTVAGEAAETSSQRNDVLESFVVGEELPAIESTMNNSFDDDLTDFLNSITPGENFTSIKTGGNAETENSMAVECLSLKVLDSQPSDVAFSDSEDEQPQSPVMELDVNLLEFALSETASVALPTPIVKEKEKDNICNNSVSTNPIPVVSSDDVESDLDVFNPCTPHSVERKKVPKRLFSSRLSLPLKKAPATVTRNAHRSPILTRSLRKRNSTRRKAVRDVPQSPMISTPLTSSRRSPTSKFQNIRNGHKVDAKSLSKAKKKAVLYASTPKPKLLVLPSLKNASKVNKKYPDKSHKTDNPDVYVISSDDELEDVMSSLNPSNTFSPTKQAVDNSNNLPDDYDLEATVLSLSPTKQAVDNSNNLPDDHDLEATMLSLSPTKQAVDNSNNLPDDHDLEATMLSLDSTNTYSPTKKGVQQYIPYYLGNVRLAVSGVMLSPFDVHYFDVEDVLVLEKFEHCQVQSQMLYLRMLFRQFNWIPRKKLVYKEIPDVSQALSELVNKELVICNDGELSLKEQLEMLSAPALKKVCKDMKLRNDYSRPVLIELMLMHVQQRTAADMLNIAQTAERVMISRVKKELPACYKLTETARDVFMRVFLLYSLVFHIHNKGSKDSTQSELMYTMLRETIGQVKFPAVPANRQSKIFDDREHVIRKQRGLDLEEKLDNCLQKKTFSSGQPLVEECKRLYISWMEDTKLLEFDQALPAHLRRYTCTNQMLRCLNLAADLLQKQKEWKEAASLYELMLKQQTYSVNRRGYWYDRLSLIYHSHIKDLTKAAKVIAEALKDPYVRVGYRLALYQRANRLLSTKAFKSAAVLVGVKHDPIIDAPKTEISGVGRSGQLPESDRTNVFLSADAQGVRMCSVESVAMEHYMTTYNLNKGLHRESSVYTTIFGLLFWDIIYLPGIPDTFFNIYQYQPLDFQTDDFYKQRKDKIDERLQEINEASVEDLKHLVEPVWEEHKDECSVCVIWDVFESAQDAVDLMSCLGPPLLADICKRFAQDYRFCRSGMPDLTMWNAGTRQYKIVEVKGPNDKLSTKQILWLDYLVRKGASAEVCHVRLDSKATRKNYN